MKRISDYSLLQKDLQGGRTVPSLQGGWMTLQEWSAARGEQEDSTSEDWGK